MSKKIFVNLPVNDLNKTIEFFTKLNFKFNPQFTDENATCMIVSDDIFVMLLVEKFFMSFTDKEIGDTKKTSEVIVTLSADSRKDVDEMVDKAIKAGGKPSGKLQEMDGMYGRAFEDLDGHIWEVFHMDMNAMKQE
jgi:uncharacterized protein